MILDHQECINHPVYYSDKHISEFILRHFEIDRGQDKFIRETPFQPYLISKIFFSSRYFVTKSSLAILQNDFKKLKLECHLNHAIAIAKRQKMQH